MEDLQSLWPGCLTSHQDVKGQRKSLRNKCFLVGVFLQQLCELYGGPFSGLSQSIVTCSDGPLHNCITFSIKPSKYRKSSLKASNDCWKLGSCISYFVQTYKKFIDYFCTNCWDCIFFFFFTFKHLFKKRKTYSTLAHGI